MPPRLPAPRGPLSRALLDHLQTGSPLDAAPAAEVDALTDDDLHLALWCCYELHHHGFEGLGDQWEWDAETLAFRAELERAFEAALRTEHQPGSLPTDPQVALRVIGTWAGPSLSRTVEHDGMRWQLQEFAIHRSAYQLKEADGHTWGLPRLTGEGRSAMIQIQSDEYGEGELGEAHAELFAKAMTELGLCADFGHYVDRLPGVTLATDNLVSMFGLNRRLRGALVGHLALFEMVSVVPMSRYLTAARRQGDLPALERFYEVHVEIDAHHADLALNGMVGPLAEAEPDLAPDMIFGAAALSRVEARFARHVLTAWNEGHSSLLDPPPTADADDDVIDLVDRPARFEVPEPSSGADGCDRDRSNRDPSDGQPSAGPATDGPPAGTDAPIVRRIESASG